MISLAVAAAGWVGVSSPGDYAAFKFPPLPRHDRVPRTEALAVVDDIAMTDLLRDKRILVVDDLSDVAEVLADMLEAAGAIAVAISDPEEAAQLMSEAPGVWSALVTDLHMAGIDGRALARHAASLSPPIPAVLVTARPDALGDAPATEFAAILSKPVTAPMLAQAVHRAIR